MTKMNFSFFKKAIPGLFSFIFIFSRVNSKSVFCLKFYWWLASNRRPLASEVTALPTEPQSLPQRRVAQLLPSQLLLQPFHQETVRMWWRGAPWRPELPRDRWMRPHKKPSNNYCHSGGDDNSEMINRKEEKNLFCPDLHLRGETRPTLGTYTERRE